VHFFTSVVQLCLQLSNYCSFEGVLYCRPHYDQLYKRTGSLDKSFEGKTHFKTTNTYKLGHLLFLSHFFFQNFFQNNSTIKNQIFIQSLLSFENTKTNSWVGNIFHLLLQFFQVQFKCSAADKHFQIDVFKEQTIRK